MPVTLLIRIVFLVTMLCLTSTSGADVLNELLSPESTDTPSTATDKIELESDAKSDADIRKRLVGIFAELDTTENVDVSVASGIVTLSGTVATASGGERATRIAGQVKGVVEVVDSLTVDTNINRRVESTLSRLQTYTLSLLAALPIFLLAVGLLVLFWWFGRKVGGHRRLFRAIAPNEFIAELLSNVARVIVTLIGLMLALTLLDATSLIGSVLGAAGIVGLAVGFAVRDTVENFIASILLSLRTPFLVRDYVQIGDNEGTVARLTSRATILISQDGNHVRVPNALVYKSVITNFSRQPNRRFEFVVAVGTNVDLGAAQQLAMETVSAVDGVLAEPSATALVTRLGDSSVSLTIGAWINQTRSDLLKTRSESIRQVKQAFDRAGIAMPEPGYQIRLQELHAEQPDVESDTGNRKHGMVEPEPALKPPLPAGADTANSEAASDTTVDESIHESIDRELAAGGTQNLLKGSVRTE